MLVHRLWPNLEKKNIVKLGLPQFCPFNFLSIRQIEQGKLNQILFSLIRGDQSRRLQEISFVDYRKPVSSVSFRQFRFVDYRKPVSFRQFRFVSFRRIQKAV